MRPSPSSRTALHTLATSCLVVTAACALEPGQPWGTVDLALSAAIAPSSTRWLGDELRTSREFAVRMDELTLSLRTATVRGRPSSGASFDPSAPPPGYGLCHGGHCHADDGRLVPYEEIEAELGGAAGAPSVVLALDTTLALEREPVAVVVPPCDMGACDLERGELGTLTVELGTLTARGELYDLATPARLPLEPMAFALEVRLNGALTTTLDARIDNGEPVHQLVVAELELTERLFDDLPWDELVEGDALGTPTGALLDAMRDTILLHSALRGTVRSP